MDNQDATVYDMFGYGIQEGDYVAFGRRSGNTSTIKVYIYKDGAFYPKWEPGEKHTWPIDLTGGRPQKSLDMTNSINLTRFIDDFCDYPEVTQ